VQPDPSMLLRIAEISIPPVGFYDAPDPSRFEPLIEAAGPSRVCVFTCFRQWQEGKTLHMTPSRYGCRGAGYWLWGQSFRSRKDFVCFLADDEGLKASHELMNGWLDHNGPYRPSHDHILVGPLQDTQYEHLKTVTFFVNPDQLSLLLLGAQYHSAPNDQPPVIAPFGSGCMQLVTLFDDLEAPQAIVGATDVAMRQHLPSDVLAFTVTKPLFERLCSLDERSFLHKPFWARLQKARQKQ
jgi:hypothetical protein